MANTRPGIESATPLIESAPHPFSDGESAPVASHTDMGAVVLTTDTNTCDALHAISIDPSEISAWIDDPVVRVSESACTTIRANEIVLRAGKASLTLKQDGTIEIIGAKIRVSGDEFAADFDGVYTVNARSVISHAERTQQLLGKLVRVDGDLVKINCDPEATG